MSNRTCNHATFLDLDTSIDKGKFMYKMFDKLDAFNFHIVIMPSVISNIPSIIFYNSSMSEFVRTLISALLLKHFLSVAKNLKAG